MTPPGDAPTPTPPEGTVESLAEELDGLAAELETSSAQTELQETQALLEAAGARGLLASGRRQLHARDTAEALVGSVIFATPLLVEDGVFDIADHLFGARVSGVPVFLLFNAVFVVVMTYALVEWTGRDQTEAHRIAGVVPTRIVMILSVSFLVVAVLMTVWGRIDLLSRPVEAAARITVLWTVGSLGAGLGDIVSVQEERAAHPAAGPNRVDAGLSDAALIANLQRQFDELVDAVDTADRRRDLQALKRQTQAIAAGDRFGQTIRKYTSRDIAEAFVGGVFFAIPLLVEDGVFDVADYFLSFRIAEFPVFFLLNAAFVLGMIGALVYWAGPQDVRMSRPILGIIPRRLVGIGIVSFFTAALLMTMWGRVAGWQDPVVAVARISAVWTVASFGAALGDILPGESSGDDLYDDLGDLVDDFTGGPEGAD